MFTGGDFHELRHGGGFLRQAELVDHHGHDHGMRVSEDSGKDKSGAQGRGRIVGTRKFADGQVLKVPLPTGHGASEAAQQPLGIRGSQKLDCRSHALAASFVEARFEKIQDRHADGAQKPRHRRHHFCAARFGEEQCQAIE